MLFILNFIAIWFSAIFYISNVSDFYFRVFSGYAMLHNLSGLQIGLESGYAVS